MRSWLAYSRCASTYALQTLITPISSRPMRRARISSRPAAVSKNHCPSCFTSGMGNGQPSAPISSVTLESELVINCVFSVRRWTNILNPAVACTTSGEIKSCPAGPKIACRALVSSISGRRHQGVDGILRRSEGLFIRSRRTHWQRQRQENQAGTGRERSHPAQPWQADRVSSAAMFAWESFG